MPCWRRCAAGPMPDSISTCGVLKAPAARITSRSALTWWRGPCLTNSTPDAGVPRVSIGRAARALLGRAVVIAAMAARIGHHVDRRGAAQHLAARRLDPAVVQVGLRLGVEAPIMQAEIVHLAHADRNVDQRVEVA